MKKIFISYRRADAEYAAGAFGRELRTVFGEGQVFRDKEDIGAGVAWRPEVLQQISPESALLVFIGKGWADVRDAQGRRRLEDPQDPMRTEITDGLRDRAKIFPILLEDARMPQAHELPDDLKALTELNARRLRDGDWGYDVQRICAALREAGFQPLPGVAQRRAAIVLMIVTYALLFIAMAGFSGEADTPYGGACVSAVLALAAAVLALRWMPRGRGVGRGFAYAACALAIFLGFFDGAMAVRGAPAHATAEAPTPGTSQAASPPTTLAVPPKELSPKELAPKELILGSWREQQAVNGVVMNTVFTYEPGGKLRGTRSLDAEGITTKARLSGTWSLRALSEKSFALTRHETEIGGTDTTTYEIVDRDTLEDGDALVHRVEPDGEGSGRGVHVRMDVQAH